MSRDPNTKLMEQQTAVMAYLEDLLNEIPEADEVEVYDNVVEVFSKQKIIKPKSSASVKPAINNEPEKKPSTEVIADDVEQAFKTQEKTKQSEKVVSKQIEPQNEVVESNDVKQAAAIQVPEWAEQEFQCLLFHVTGITLAVPLVKLNGVIPWSEDITPMPGHSPAFLGILRHLQKNVQVMDAAEVILPDNQRQEVLPASERVNKIILMDEGKWGLACDDIGEVITLQNTDVRWRTAEGRRTWLAGTVSDRLCALLDTDSLSKMLAEGEKS